LKDYKNNKDYKDSICKDSYPESDDTNQQSSQNNICYKGGGCEQANGGQQMNGKDNVADGFNDRQKRSAEAAAWCLRCVSTTNPIFTTIAITTPTNRHPHGHRASPTLMAFPIPAIRL
jgi:hypothetical protein